LVFEKPRISNGKRRPLFTFYWAPKVCFPIKNEKNKRMRSGIDWCKANRVWDVKELPFLPTSKGCVT
jgi:hypothetical protein